MAAMDVVLRTQTPDLLLALRDITGFADGSGYVAKLQVRSGGFVLDRPFYFDEAGLADFLSAVDAMDRTLAGSAELRTPGEEDFLRLELGPRGSVSVTGESWEYSELGQRLRFGFTTDQTALRPFFRDLQGASRRRA